MKIAIIGYGKMGKLIEEAAIKRKHKVVTIDPIVKADFKTMLARLCQVPPLGTGSKCSSSHASSHRIDPHKWWRRPKEECA